MRYSFSNIYSNGTHNITVYLQDNLLYYLNNHRGGFFRFFNGGSAFGDLGALSPQPAVGAAGQNYNQQQSQYAQQYPLYSHQNYVQQPQPQPTQESTNNNLAFLTGLADAVNQSGGINLSNLGANAGILGNLASFVGSMTGLGGGSVDNGSGGSIGEMFGNLLTGFVGNRFSSRRISKRSVVDGDAKMMNETRADLDPLMSLEKDSKYVKETASKKRNLNTEMKTAAEAEDSKENPMETVNSYDEEEEVEEIFAEDENEDDNEDNAPEARIVNESPNQIEQPEGRILNRKPQPSRYQLHLNMVNFPSQNDHRFEKKIKFTDHVHLNSVSPQHGDVFVFKTNYVETQPLSPSRDHFRFPVNNAYTDHRGSKRIKFEQTGEQQQQVQRPFDYGQHEHRIKMVFPDRTGTGNLKFDSAEFETEAPPPVRYGRILSGLGQQSQQMYRPFPEENSHEQNQHNYQDNNQNSNQNIIQHVNYVTSRPTYNRYEHYEDYTRYPPLKRVGSSNYGYDRSGDKPASSTPDSSQNVYVTNSKGVVEYYINAAGKKVYV